MSGHDCDVLIAGGGPTGVTLAILLGQRGLKVIVAEKEADIYALPRAAHPRWAARDAMVGQHDGVLHGAELAAVRRAALVAMRSRPHDDWSTATLKTFVPALRACDVASVVAPFAERGESPATWRLTASGRAIAMP